MQNCLLLAVFVIGMIAVLVLYKPASKSSTGAGGEERKRRYTIGMSGAEVASVLGSPNIVSTDEDRNETWVYDKISSDVTYSRSSGTIVGLIFSGGGAGAGVGSSSSGATSTSQRTLTVIIKFDEQGQVRDFSYHSSRF